MTAVKLPNCPTCHKWAQYIGSYGDTWGNAVRCRGCRRISSECHCRP